MPPTPHQSGRRSAASRGTGSLEVDYPRASGHSVFAPASCNGGKEANQRRPQATSVVAKRGTVSGLAFIHRSFTARPDTDVPSGFGKVTECVSIRVLLIGEHR